MRDRDGSSVSRAGGGLVSRWELEAADLVMFEAADADGSGDMSLEEFLAFSGALNGDIHATARFHE